MLFWIKHYCNVWGWILIFSIEYNQFHLLHQCIILALVLWISSLLLLPDVQVYAAASIHSFIHTEHLYIEPLQENYSEALPTPARLKRAVLSWEKNEAWIYPSGERQSWFYSSNSLSYFKSLVRLLCLLFIFIIFIYQLTVPYLLCINSLFCSMFSGVAELRSVNRCRFCIH